MLRRLEERLSILARRKQKARKRGDPNFYRISKEHKAMKARVKALGDKERPTRDQYEQWVLDNLPEGET